MYTDLNLYYLQQLGITPWVRRDLVHTLSLVIFIPVKISIPAKQLLNNCLAILTLNKKDFTVVEVHDAKIDLPSNIGTGTFALIFGEQLNKQISANFRQRIIAPDLENVINNPREKKEIWEKFIQIQPLTL